MGKCAAFHPFMYGRDTTLLHPDVFDQDPEILLALLSASSSNQSAFKTAKPQAKPTPNIQLKYHIVVSLVEAIALLLDERYRYLAAQFVINPAGIADDNWHEYGHR